MKLDFKINTIPNYLSLFRLIISPVVGHYLYWNNLTLALILLILAYLSDVADGIIARKYKQESEFGKIIDPIADKLLYAFIAFALFLNGKVPLWFFAVYLLRELLILGGSYLFASKIKEIPKSNIWGKISAFSIAISLLGVILGIPYFVPYALITSLILSYFSTFKYFKLGLEKIKR